MSSRRVSYDELNEALENGNNNDYVITRSSSIEEETCDDIRENNNNVITLYSIFKNKSNDTQIMENTNNNNNVITLYSIFKNKNNDTQIIDEFMDEESFDEVLGPWDDTNDNQIPSLPPPNHSFSHSSNYIIPPPPTAYAPTHSASYVHLANAYQKLSSMEAENKRLREERDKYKRMAAALKDQLTKGPAPRRSLYQSEKCDVNNRLTEWSSNVKQLYLELKGNYGHEKVSQHIEKLDKKIKKSIIKFIDLNSEKDFLNPWVKIKGETLKLNDIINKEIIQSGHRIEELVGKYGIYASKDIPKNTVIGKYIGTEVTNKEWNEVFDYSDCDVKHGEYLYTFHIDEKAQKNSIESRQVTIDPLEGNLMDVKGDGSGKDLKLLYINDMRQDIFNPTPTKEDKQLQNTSFVVAKVYGWPWVFVVSIKDIKKGDELLLDYGEAYSVLIKENKRWKAMMAVQGLQIMNNIIGDSEMTDNYCLDL